MSIQRKPNQKTAHLQVLNNSLQVLNNSLAFGVAELISEACRPTERESGGGYRGEFEALQSHCCVDNSKRRRLDESILVCRGWDAPVPFYWHDEPARLEDVGAVCHVLGRGKGGARGFGEPKPVVVVVRTSTRLDADGLCILLMYFGNIW